MQEHLTGEGVISRVERRKLAQQLEDVRVASEPAEQDATGAGPREVALLAQLGLEPQWRWRLRRDRLSRPRQDPGQLANPAAAVAGATRLR